jgi:transposase
MPAKQTCADWPTRDFDDSVSGCDSEVVVVGKSPLAASAERRDGLERLAVSSNRAEADRARAVLLSLSGWTSAAIGEAFGVREDTVRDWRSTFMREGVAGVERHPAPGCSPVKAEAALAVARELFAAPVENRINWTLPRLSEQIERRAGHRVSRSRLSVVLRKKDPMRVDGGLTW